MTRRGMCIGDEENAECGIGGRGEECGGEQEKETEYEKEED